MWPHHDHVSALPICDSWGFSEDLGWSPAKVSEIPLQAGDLTPHIQSPEPLSTGSGQTNQEAAHLGKLGLGCWERCWEMFGPSPWGLPELLFNQYSQVHLVF